MIYCKTCATPKNVNEKLSAYNDLPKIDEKFYRSMGGSLMYLTNTRPDIMVSVSIVSRFVSSPSTRQLGAAKRIMRYVCGTKDYGLFYDSSSNFQSTGCVDSDWAGDKDDRKSTR